jgi:hypothetical protein
MTFDEMLEKVPDENLRKEMKEEFNRTNQLAGERGRKLIEKDSELNSLKKNKGEQLEWGAAFDILKKKGLDPKDIPDILDKMELQKTAADELKLVTGLYKDASEKVKAYEKQLKDGDIRKAVDTVFAEVRKNFKNDKGEALKVVDDFIDTGKLYADISDTNNRVLLEQRANEVLTLALQKQEAIVGKLGFQGAPTFKVPEGDSNPGGVNNVSAQLKKTAQEAGASVALSEYYKLTKVNS